MITPADTVKEFVRALRQRDFDAAQRLLAGEFVFHGPFDTFRDPQSYISALRGLYSIVKKVTPRKLFVDGEDVCLLYEMETNTAIGTAFICEWFKVGNGAIRSILAVFDARPFVPMFSN